MPPSCVNVQEACLTNVGFGALDSSTEYESFRTRGDPTLHYMEDSIKEEVSRCMGGLGRGAAYLLRGLA